MSLSSLLLSGANKDDSLDALFASNPPPPKPAGKPVPTPSNAPVQQRGQKRKLQPEISAIVVEQPKVKSSPSKSTKRHKSAVEKPQKVAKKAAKPVSESEDAKDNEDDEEDEDDAMLEDNYLTRRSAATVKKSAEQKDSSEEDVDENDDSDDSDAPPPTHETSTGARSRTRPKPAKRVKYVPPGETPAQRAARTIFVGNIPIEAAKSKSTQKALKRHFTTLVPSAKIESMRFRSIAFAAPTAPEESSTPSTKEKRQIERAATWRETDDAEHKSKGKRKAQEEEETSDREGQSKKPAHTTLTPAERKRVAFIKGEFHDGMDSINAYIVFAHSVPTAASAPIAAEDTATPTNKSSNNLDPTEAARLAVLNGDGTTFMSRTIRVDRVGASRTKTDDAQTEPLVTGNPRATVFVGNLDFAAKEEDLRVWFEGVVATERGPPPEGDASGSEAEMEVEGGLKKNATWVRSVRIVRDRDTQLGKGFAYVRFADRECVDELLNLDASILKFAKRTLRIQRYKGIPGATPKSTTVPNKSKHDKSKPKSGPGGSNSNSKPDAKPKRGPPMPIPKGDPTLGSKLAGLSKDERKAAKAGNADRVQRRLAKKRAKGVDKSSVEKVERKRERRGAGDKGNLKARAVAKKGRVRSEKSVAKRNAKK